MGQRGPSNLTHTDEPGSSNILLIPNWLWRAKALSPGSSGTFDETRQAYSAEVALAANARNVYTVAKSPERCCRFGNCGAALAAGDLWDGEA